MERASDKIVMEDPYEPRSLMGPEEIHLNPQLTGGRKEPADRPKEDAGEEFPFEKMRQDPHHFVLVYTGPCSELFTAEFKYTVSYIQAMFNDLQRTCELDRRSILNFFQYTRMAAEHFRHAFLHGRKIAREEDGDESGGAVPKKTKGAKKEESSFGKKSAKPDLSSEKSSSEHEPPEPRRSTKGAPVRLSVYRVTEDGEMEHVPENVDKDVDEVLGKLQETGLFERK